MSIKRSFAPDNLYKPALKIIQILQQAGFEAYVAGGAVRDYLLRRPVQDLDIATSARPDDVRTLFKQTFAVGESFGVVIVRLNGQNFDVATFREEDDYEDGRHPNHVAFSTARADVLRRDFTMNGMLWDSKQGQVLDWVDGRTDIEAKLVRTIGKPDLRFEEDRLRMLRALRFAAQLQFQIEDKTWSAICKAAPKLDLVSTERMRDELQKILMAPDACRGLKLLTDSNLEPVIIRRILLNCNELKRNKSLLGKLNGSLNGMFSADLPEDRLDRWLVVFVSLLLGMPHNATTTKQQFDWKSSLRTLDKPSFINIIAHMMRGYRLSNQDNQEMIAAIQVWLDLMEIGSRPLAEQLRTLRSDGLPRCRRLLPTLCAEDAPQIDQWIEQMLARHGENLWPAAWLNGGDLIRLGVPKGPQMKTMLHELENAQLENSLNSKAAAEALVQSRLRLQND